MKNLLVSTLSASALTLFIAAPALAADLKGERDVTSADYVSGRAAFQGVGVGVNGGGQFTNIDVMDQFDGIGADGLAGGAHVEYLFGMGTFRVGPYVDGGISNVNTEILGYDLLNQDWYVGAGVKAGVVLWNSTLVYGKLGYEYSQWSIAEDAFEADVDSVVIGGGVETMISQNVSIGLEANYIVPLSIEVQDKDLTDYLEESETIRALARVTYRH